MTKKSFIKNTIFLLTIQMLLLIMVLFGSIYSSYQSAMENVEEMADGFLQVYGKELDNKINNTEQLLSSLLYGNRQYNLLKSADESNRYFAAVELKKQLQEHMNYNKSCDMVVIAESDYEICIDAESNVILYPERETIRKYVLESAGKGRGKAEWSYIEANGRPYIYRMYIWQKCAVGAFIEVDNFMRTAEESHLENMALMLTDAEGCLLGGYRTEYTQWEVGDTIKDTPYAGWVDRCYELAEGSFRLHLLTGIIDFGGQMQSSMITLLVIIVCSVIFTTIIVIYIRSQILMPMRNMQQQMEKIQDGQLDLRMEENYQNVEFNTLKDTFNNLMDEILHLKIQKYEKQLALQENELKCVKLQIRPHFFLNAMTTISSLSIQGKTEEIKIYIDALSKNIRYMFGPGLHTVTVEEEIRHVENYFEMQALKYPNCVFHFIEMEPEAEGWLIPQMIIHTIIENEYKYAVSVDTMLTILIKIAVVSVDGEEMLSIEIEDDGKGYPQEVLEQFASKTETPTRSGNRIGLWSIRRMLELMYERENLLKISNIEPHGCLNQFLIPKEPVHEIKMDTSANKID